MQAKRPTEILPHGEGLPHTRASLAISRFLGFVSGAVSWLWVALLAVIVVNVTLRYAFGEGRVEFEEIQWHLYAVGFLLGLSVCLDTDDHIRVGLVRDRLGPRAQAWIELYGLVLLFFPFVAMVLIFALPFVAYSFSMSEISDAPAGLPYRWAIKSMLIVAFGLLALAGIGRLLRVSALLFGTPRRLSPQRRPDVD